MTALTVVVADPHRELTELAVEVLIERGLNASTALTVTELTAALRPPSSVDVAVCHATLPIDAGDEQRHALRAVLAERLDIGLVVISSRPFEDIEGIPAFAVCLQKPFGAVELLEAVQEAHASRPLNEHAAAWVSPIPGIPL